MNYTRYSQSHTIREAIRLGARQGDLDYDHRKRSLSFEDGTVIHYFSPTPSIANAGAEDGAEDSAVPAEAEAEDGKLAKEVEGSYPPTLLDLKQSTGIVFIQLNPKTQPPRIADSTWV